MKTTFSPALRRLLVLAGLVATAASAQAGLLGAGGALSGGGSLTGFGQLGRMNPDGSGQRPMLVDRGREALQKGGDAARAGASRVEDRTTAPRSVEAGAAAAGSVKAGREGGTRSVEAGAQAGASAGARSGTAAEPQP